MKNKDISKLTEKYLKETDENIVGVSYGYNMVNGKFTTEKVISFTVKKKLPLNEIPSNNLLPKQIEHLGETFNTDVVQGEFKLLDVGFCYSDHYTWWEYWQPIPTIPTNRNEHRPIKGGISVTNYTSKMSTVGTLGFLAVDNETNAVVGVSNNHVLIDDAFIVSERSDLVVTNIAGDIATQPHESGNYGLSKDVGIVNRYVPISSSTPNRVDAALIGLNESVINENESWKQEGLTINSPLPFATTSEIDNLLVSNLSLFSAGRTSGAKGELETKLKISHMGSIVIQYEKQNVPTTVTFNDCLVFVASGSTITPGDTCFFPIAPGDSGSALIAEIGGVKKIIGLCFAGSVTNILLDPEDPNSGVEVSYYGIANRIDKVAEELNISAWNGTIENYSDRNSIEECVVEGKDPRPYITKDGKIYWQVGLTNSTNLCVPD